MSENTYAVFGPGWGSEMLAPNIGGGDLAYRGPSLSEARRVLADRRAVVARMRRREDMRNVSDTYGIWRIGPDVTGWVPLS
jgi:hypothetical protein